MQTAILKSTNVNLVAKSILDVFFAPFTLFSRVSTAVDQTARFKEVSNLTDTELADRYGINRDQILPYILDGRI